MAEKKIITGNTWKASINPIDFAPPASLAPGGRARGPNRNSAPAPEALRNTRKTLLRKRKTFGPYGNKNIKKEESAKAPANKQLTPIRHVATPWCTQIGCRKIVAVYKKTGHK